MHENMMVIAVALAVVAAMCFVTLRALTLKREADDERAISRAAEHAAMIGIAARSLRVVETYQAAIREQAEFANARTKKGDEDAAFEYRQNLLAQGAGQGTETIHLTDAPPPKNKSNKETEPSSDAGVQIANDVPLSMGNEPPV
jgi:hypothetical protein